MDRLLRGIFQDANLVIIGAATIVKVTDLGTIEDILLQGLVDLVVHMTRPDGCGRARRHLWREPSNELAKVPGTFTTGSIINVSEKSKYDSVNMCMASPRI